MSPFDIVKKIYTLKSFNWVYELNDNEIDVYMIQKTLSMNPQILDAVRGLRKYTKNPDKKQYLALACAVIPKYSKAPYIPYLKAKTVNDDIYKPVLDKIQKILRLTHNDIVDEAKYYIAEIEKDKEHWFRKLGMSKEIWIKHGLDFEEMRGGEQRDIKVGLEMFGL